MIILEITKEQLVEILDNAVKKALLENKDFFKTINPANEVFTLVEASKFLKVSKSTIYGKVSRSAIPYSKKGRRLFFSEKSLLEWIESGRRKTVEEISKESPSILLNK